MTRTRLPVCEKNVGRHGAIPFFVVLWAAFLYLSTTTVAQGQPNESPYLGIACGSETTQLTEAEVFALEQICSGQSVDFRNIENKELECRFNNRLDAGIWIRSDFFEYIASSRNFFESLPRPNIEIECVLIRGEVDLRYNSIIPAIHMESVRFENDLSLFNVEISRRLYFKWVEFEGTANFANTSSGASIVFVESTFRGPVDFSLAQVSGNLNFDDVDAEKGIFASQIAVSGSVYFRNHSIIRELFVGGARINGNLEITRSSIIDELDASGSNISGSLYLRGVPSDGGISDARFGSVSISKARVQGNLEFVSGVSYGDFDASGVIVNGSLFLRHGVEVQGLTRLVGAEIGGNLEFSNGVFLGPVQASPVDVGNSIIARSEAEFSYIAVRGSSVRGNVEFDTSTVSEELDLRGVDVEGSVYLRNGATMFDVRSAGASISGNLELSGGAFVGAIDFSASSLGSALVMVDQNFGLPIWKSGSSLNLRSSETRVLLSVADSWSHEDGSDLRKNIDGFQMEFISTYPVNGSLPLDRVNGDWLDDWFTSRLDEFGRVAPQPYENLAAVYRRMGYPEMASLAHYKRYEHELQSGDISVGSRILLALSKFLVGFGVYPFRLAYWFAAVVLLGVIVGRWSRDLKTLGWIRRFWYSLENSIPFVELDGEHGDLRHENLLVSSFYHIQKIMGFLMATILVGALTVLS